MNDEPIELPTSAEGKKQIFEQVKYILNSRDEQVINTLKLSLRAYIHCIDAHNDQRRLREKHARLRAEKEALQ